MRELEIAVDGSPASVLESGAGPHAMVLLHGGTAGLSPYAPCAVLWEPLIEQLAGDMPRVVAIDLPGCGATAVAGKDSLLLDSMSGLVRDALGVLGISRAIVVGHGTASLIALALAREPGDIEIAGAAVIAGTGAAPTGDSLSSTTLAYPPSPAWSAQAQRWSLERLSFTGHHVTPELVDKLVEAAAGEPHAQAAALFAEPEVALEVQADRLSGKMAFLAYCRDHGYGLPITIIWAADDPLLSVPHGDTLFEVLSTTTAHLDFALIGRAGHLPHRERPAEVAYQLKRLHALA